MRGISLRFSYRFTPIVRNASGAERGSSRRNMRVRRSVRPEGIKATQVAHANGSGNVKKGQPDRYGQTVDVKRMHSRMQISIMTGGRDQPFDANADARRERCRNEVRKAAIAEDPQAAATDGENGRNQLVRPLKHGEQATTEPKSHEPDQSERESSGREPLMRSLVMFGK